MTKVVILSSLVLAITVLLSSIPQSESSLWDLVVYAKPTTQIFYPSESPAIAGKVVNQADRPVSDVQVKIRFGGESATTSTNEEGVFFYDFGVKERISGIYIVNIVATGEDGKIGLASTQFEIKGKSLPSSHAEQRFDSVYSDDLDVENNPIDALIFKHRQEIAQKLEQERLKQQELEEYQKFLDEQRQIAAAKLNETLSLETQKESSYTERWYFPRFMESLDKSVKGIIGTQLNYTSDLWIEARAAMNEVLDSGGTWQQARDAFFKKAAVSRQTMESLTINKTNSTVSLDVNATSIESLVIENMTSVEQIPEVLDVNGTAIKTGINGTIIRLNVNGTIMEFLINGTTAVQLNKLEEPKEDVEEPVEVEANQTTDDTPEAPKTSMQSQYGSLKINTNEILIKRYDVELQISGSINDYGKAAPIHLKITKPDNTVEKLQTRVSSYGHFETIWFVKSSFSEGTYLIEASFDDKKIGSLEFVVKKAN